MRILMKKRIKPLIIALPIVLVALLFSSHAARFLPADYDEDDYLRAGQIYSRILREGDILSLSEVQYNYEHPGLAKIAIGISLLGIPDFEDIPEVPTSSPPNQNLPSEALQKARGQQIWWQILTVFLLSLVQPLAGLFLGIHSFAVKYTAQVMLEALPLLLSTLSVLAYRRSRNQENLYFFLSSLFLGMTAAGKYLYAVAGIAVVIHIAFFTRKNRLRKILLYTAISLGMFYLCDPYLWPDPIRRLADSLFFHSRYSSGGEVSSANMPLWQPLVWLFSTTTGWHHGIILIGLDFWITLLGIIGFPQLWKKEKPLALWLLTGLFFLFLWPTKWPQYILILLVPLCFSASLGITQRLLPLLRKTKLPRRKIKASGTTTPSPLQILLWLTPGLFLLFTMTYFPLITQFFMGMTDFSFSNIRDGFNGGILRAVTHGLRGDLPVHRVSNIWDFQGGKEVGFIGLWGYFTGLRGWGPGLMAFEILWTLLSLITQGALGIGAALLLHHKGVRFRNLWTVIFILPWAVPEFIGATIWSQIFHPDFGWFSLAAKEFSLLGSGGSWQENPNTSFLVLLVSNLWMGFPMMMLGAQGGLLMINRDVIEAAQLDGAPWYQRLSKISLPLLLPFLVPLLILRGVQTFNQFYLFWVMNPPWPLSTFATTSYWVARYERNYAAAGVINIYIVVILMGALILLDRKKQLTGGPSHG